MRTSTKIQLVDLAGELITIGIGIVTAVGITAMKKPIAESIIEKDKHKDFRPEKKRFKNPFNKKK